MKKIILPLLVTTTIFGGLITNNNINEVDADVISETISNTSDDWKISLGSGLKSVDIDNGVRIGNIKGTYTGMYKTEKVALDGLSFTFNNVIGKNCKAGGFYFSQKTTHEFTKNVFTLWHDPYNNNQQARLSLTSNHDYGQLATCYTTPTFENTGFISANSMVMNNFMSTNDGFSVKFEKYSLTAWKVTITQLYANTLWENNANYDSATKSCAVYLKNSDVKSYLDDDGKAYFHVFGVDNNATDAYYEITNLKREYDPGKKVTKQQVLDSINSISDDMINSFINKKEIASQLLKAKEDAINSLSSAPESGLLTEYRLANEFLEMWESRTDLYGYKPVSSTISDNLPYVSSVGKNGAQLTAQNDLQLSIDAVFGNRIYSKEIMDAANFEISFNLGKIPLYTAFQIVLNKTSSPSTYIDSEEKYYFFEFYKTAENTYFMMFGNGTKHNISIDEFGTEKLNSTYTGRTIESASGDMKIKLETNFEKGSSTLDVNNGYTTLQLQDNSKIFNGQKATKKVESNVLFGLINGTGLQPVIITKLFSPDTSKKEFIKGSNDTLSFLYSDDNEIQSLKLDNNEVPSIAYDIVNNQKIILKTFYLNYLEVGKHTLKMLTASKETSWELTILENNDKEEVPWIRKGAIYIAKGQAIDEKYDFESYGLNVNDMTFKIDDDDMTKDSYEFLDCNTVLVLKASFLNNLSIGKHFVSIIVKGASTIVKLPIIVK